MSEYHKLLQSPSSESSNENLGVDTKEIQYHDDFDNKRKALTTLARHAALLFCIVCTVTNVIIAVFTVFPANNSNSLANTCSQTDLISSYTNEDIAKLRRPSQFIRFDEIKRSSPPIPRQFDNHPILIAQVDSEHPDHIFGEVTRRYMAGAGTITPEDRRVLVTPNISTVVQFRAIDYGMGSCELRLTVPASLMHGNNPGLLDSFQSRPLTIYRLNATTALSARTLNMKTRPERVARVAEVLLRPEEGTYGLVWHRKFVCEENEILTFELACGTTALGDSCTVEWWQDRESPNPAVYFRQYSTI